MTDKLFTYEIAAYKNSKAVRLFVGATNLESCIRLVVRKGYDEPQPEDIHILNAYDEVIVEGGCDGAA